MILLLSFIKQVFNYVFVSNDLQNKLLRINLLGVLLGVGIGIPLIMQYGLIGGLLTQALLEILFVAGALWIAWRHHVFPTLKRPLLCIFAFGASGLIRGGTAYLQKISYEADLLWISCAFVLTVLIT